MADGVDDEVADAMVAVATVDPDIVERLLAVDVTPADIPMIPHDVARYAIAGSVFFAGPAIADAVSGWSQRAQAQSLVIDGVDEVALLSRLLGHRLCETRVNRGTDRAEGTLTVVRGIGVTPSATAPGPITVSDVAWDGLKALAARTYVPESTRSRASGAGANLDDNE